MAASIQERLKLKQYQVDTWTTREQLCLASAVMRSGDQNWVAVRRNIKMLTNETSRPPDWYSTKNCALQYARLLERVDTPKRKRERGDGGNETPGEIVTRMLSKQRIEELQVLEAEERATYSQLRREIQQLEARKLDHQLDTFWEQLVKEQAEEEEREQRQQQWLKEREEKITAIQQALKHQGPKVPQPPHKKKPKLQVGGCVGMAESRRSSGLSETSSEVDSAAESPDLNEVTSESLVSNKSQDESGLVESEPKPTPTSPLLSSLLSKSPITGVPGAASSPLAQLGIGGRTVRGPVSEALQQLVSTRILGTNTVDKDKATHTTSGTGTSTLSRLLDLPPSTPGGPLPTLSDLPGPSYEQKEQLTAPLKACEKNEDNCCDKKSCDEQVTVEETKPSSHEKPTRNIVTVGAPKEAQKEAERDLPVSQKEQRNVEESDEDKRDLHTSHRTCDKKEEGEKKESAELEQRVRKDQGKEEEKEDKEQLEKGTEKHEEEEEKPEQKLEDKLQQEHKGIQQEVPDEMQDTPTKIKTTDEQTPAKEEPEVQKISNAGIEHGKMQSEESVQEAESISKESGNGTQNEVPSLSQSCMSVTTMAETGQEDCKSTCMPEKEGCKPKMDCEVTEHQDKGLKREGNEEGHQGVEEEDNREDEVVAAAGVAEEEEEEEEEERKEEEEEISAEVTTRTEMAEEEEEEDEEEEDDEEGDEEEDEDKPATELEGQVREDLIEGKKGEEGESRKTAEKEGESFGNLNQPEDRSISPVMEKDLKMAMGIKEQEDDYHDGQDSKDWVSEEEGSIFGGRKRKISGGDIISSSSPLISYSSPNSPASTHYGDDSENEKAYRSWKKPIMILWNDIAAHKFASLFLRPITDDQAPGYHSVVYRPMDLQKIKRNIESGVIRTTAEFQRDIMLMFLNATMYNTHDHNVYHMAHHMMKDAVSTIQDFLTTQMLVRAEDTPQKSLRRETRESSAKRSDDDSKRKRDSSDEKNLKKRRLN